MENRKMNKSEGALRSRARRNGLALRKSRREIDLDKFGGYMLIDVETNVIVLGSRFDADLDAVAQYLE